MNKNNIKKLNKIEQIFGAADDVVTNMEEKTGGMEITLGAEAYEIEEQDEVLPVAIGDDVFSLTELKTDFTLARRNLRKLIRRGQTLMDTLQNADLEDMTAGKIMAIAQLSTSVSQQLKMLSEMYKDIMEIEKGRNGPPSGSIGPSITGVTGDINMIFAGDTKSLMKHIKGNN